MVTLSSLSRPFINIELMIIVSLAKFYGVVSVERRKLGSSAVIIPAATQHLVRSWESCAITRTNPPVVVIAVMSLSKTEVNACVLLPARHGESHVSDDFKV